MLSDISAVATLVLFFIYFIGRVITIAIEKDICHDKITFESSDGIREKYEIVDEISTLDNQRSETDFCTTIVLTSTQGIWEIKVFEIAYDEEFNRKESCDREIASYAFLNIGQSYAINTFVPEIFPAYRIEYRTQDMKKVTFEISDNLKNGVISEKIVPNHTIKSIIYYLFR